MKTLSKKILSDNPVNSITKVKLVRDAIGGIRMTTENDQVLQNVFVKGYERIEGSVTRVNLEVIYIAPDEKGQNW